MRLGRRDEALADVKQAKKSNPHLQPEGFGAQLLGQFDAEKGTEDFRLVKELWDAV